MGETENLDFHVFWMLGAHGNPYLWISNTRLPNDSKKIWDIFQKHISEKNKWELWNLGTLDILSFELSKLFNVETLKFGFFATLNCLLTREMCNFSANHYRLPKEIPGTYEEACV